MFFFFAGIKFFRRNCFSKNNSFWKNTDFFQKFRLLLLQALHIIFVFSEDFLELLQSETDRSLKRYIYDLSNGEYAQTLCNRRFRPVVFEVGFLWKI